MPPKAKFTREEIVNAALAIVERDGFERLTARALGEELGSSARPIFTVFKSMDEVVDAVVAEANAVYGRYVERGLAETPAFKGVGKAYIQFAAERPRLFGLLFMSVRGRHSDTGSVLPVIEEHYGEILGSVRDAYGLDEQAARSLYFNTWVYTHGIASLIATGMCKFTEEEISASLTTVFVALLTKQKSEGRS